MSVMRFNKMGEYYVCRLVKPEPCITLEMCTMLKVNTLVEISTKILENFLKKCGLHWKELLNSMSK